MKLSYDEWYAKANSICERKIGLGLDDLPDACYADMYEDGYTPAAACKQALSDAGAE